MAFSEYLIVRHFLAQALAAEGMSNIPLLLPPRIMLLLVVETIRTNPLTLIFWGIAIWEAYWVPRQRPALWVTEQRKRVLF